MVCWKRALAEHKSKIRTAKQTSWRNYVSELKYGAPQSSVYKQIRKISGKTSKKNSISLKKTIMLWQHHLILETSWQIPFVIPPPIIITRCVLENINIQQNKMYPHSIQMINTTFSVSLEKFQWALLISPDLKN